ncbi:hypothetical protein [Streptomyces osmaniensis]
MKQTQNLALVLSLVLSLFLAAACAGRKSEEKPEEAIRLSLTAMCYAITVPAPQVTLKDGSRKTIPFCIDLKSKGISVAPEEEPDLFFGRPAPPDGFAIVECDTSLRPKGSHRFTTAAFGALGEKGSVRHTQTLKGILESCSEGHGVDLSRKPPTAWGPLGGGGEGPSADSISCTSTPSSPYGMGHIKGGHELLYDALKATYNLPQSIFNAAADLDVFSLLEDKQNDEFLAAVDQWVWDRDTSQAAWEAELAQDAAEEAALAAENAARDARNAPGDTAKMAAATKAAAAAAKANSAANAAQIAADVASQQKDEKKRKEEVRKAEEKRKEAEAAAQEANKQAGSNHKNPRPDSEETSACLELKNFMEKCGHVKWSSTECETWLANARGCASPTLINPGPDGVLVCGGEPSITPGVEGRLIQACRADISHPTPDSGPVCIGHSNGWIGGAAIVDKFGCDSTVAQSSDWGCPDKANPQAPVTAKMWCPPPIPNTPFPPCVVSGDPGWPPRPADHP